MSMCYVIVVMNVFAGACGTETAVLTGARGEFGSNYGTDESCQWRIQVDEDQVNISGVYGSSSTLVTRTIQWHTRYI